jgi:hypothetical protein
MANKEGASGGNMAKAYLAKYGVKPTKHDQLHRHDGNKTFYFFFSSKFNQETPSFDGV